MEWKERHTRDARTRLTETDFETGQRNFGLSCLPAVILHGSLRTIPIAILTGDCPPS